MKSSSTARDVASLVPVGDSRSWQLDSGLTPRYIQSARKAPCFNLPGVYSPPDHFGGSTTLRNVNLLPRISI